MTEVPEPLADAVAAVYLANRARERQQLIHDLAQSDPYGIDPTQCRYCGRWSDQEHTDDCLWVRARRLTNEVQP
jgi:hypothetical protein